MGEDQKVVVGMAQDNPILVNKDREDLARVAANAALIPASSNAEGQKIAASKLVRQMLIYPARDVNSNYDPTIQGHYVGVITLMGDGKGGSEVRVQMNDPEIGAVGTVHTEPVYGDIDGAMYSAWLALDQQFPGRYTRPIGSTFDARTSTALTPSNVYVLNREQQMSLTSPTIRKWTNWLRERLPNQFIPVLDKFLDFVSVMRTRWVDNYAAMREVEAMYEKATGRPSTVITRMMRDIGEGIAFAHRNFSAGYANMVNGKQQSMRDRIEAVRDAMVANNISQAKIDKIVYGLEEAVRHNIMINSPESSGYWATDNNGVKYLVDRTSGRAMHTVTGFNFKDLNTLKPNEGGSDLGAKRFMAALAGLSEGERSRIGRVVAEISATGRTIAELQKARGVISGEEFNQNSRRGKAELDAAFPELAAQGYDFGGFFITMRDAESNPYTQRESLGRTSAVEDVLANTARVWEAEVARAFRNNEMAQFALMVMEMPNKHFAIEPVTPRNDTGDPTAAPIWEESTKGEKASTTIYINGVPVKLVAKSKQAAMLFEEHTRMHPALAKIGSLNHYFNQFKTSLNPAYPLFGLGRDIMTGYLNISGAIGEQYVSARDASTVGAKTIGYALKYLLVPGKDNLFYGTATGKQRSAWAEAYQRLGAGMLFGDDLNTGTFLTRGSDLLSVGKTTGRVVDVLSSATEKTKSVASRVAETIAYPPETAMRLGAFRAYTEHLFGSQITPTMTAEQIVALFDAAKNPQNSDKAAAIIIGTKNLTSNFQQHGTDAVVRNLFSFHNAVMQGSFSTMPQILSTEHGRKTAALILIGTVVVAAANIADEEEDEFGNSQYFHNTRRNRSIIFGDNLQVPISDEIGWIKNLGDNIVGVMMGKRNVMDAATDQLHAMAEMTTTQTWGDTDNGFTNALYAVSPTMVQPFVAMSSGYDVFGRKLKNDYAYDEKGNRLTHAADIERTTQRATVAGTGIAEFLYGATSGGVDMTGDEVDVIGRAYLGGLYNSFARTQTEVMRNGDGVLSASGDEFLRSTRPIKINNQSDEAWRRLGERLGVSTRHAGGTLDVLNAQENPTVTDAMKIYTKAEAAAKKAKSDMGYTYKQLNDKIAKAEAAGRYQDARDLRADMRTIRTNAEEIRMEAYSEIRLLGVE